MVSGPKRFLCSPVALLIGLTALLSLNAPARAQVSARTEKIVLPTYEVGPAEPNPMFYGGRTYQGAQGRIYPYPFLDRLTNTRHDKAYTALYLENEYLRLCILPEIGGRIFEALDKTNGYDVIYRQHVVKPALIGMLGAWISGGVEWNIPHHHRATTFMPVDWVLAENPDGSRTAWVGEIELRHRMKWIVGVTLFPGRSLIEVTIRVFNRTPLPQSILAWANVAAHANESYQILFPPSTEFATFHAKNQFSRWPLSREFYNRVDYRNGVDVSWWKNHPAPTSFFAWNAKEDFFGGYDHGREAGIAFIADHGLAPGKKLWTWGTGSEGTIWEKILTETDGPYLELMVGAFSDNQPDYSWIRPGETREVKEFWYPIRLLKGLKKANRDAACNLETAGEGRVRLALNTTAEFRNAAARLVSGDKVLFEELIDIGPAKPYAKDVAFGPGVCENDLRLSLRADDGRELISYRPTRSAESSMPAPVTPPPAPGELATVEDLLLTGLRLEQLYNPAHDPLAYYQEALRRDPGETRALTALAVHDLKRGLYSEGEDKLRRALDRLAAGYIHPKNGEVFYYLGFALRGQGRDREAEDAFREAAWDEAWRSAASLSLAEIAMGREETATALETIETALAGHSLDTRAWAVKAAALRRRGRPEDAVRAASRAVSLDPLDFRAANEIFLASKAAGRAAEADAALESLSRLMRDSDPNYLELAGDYASCGLWGEAADILLRRAQGRTQSSFPLIHYHLAYYLDRSGRGDEALRRARRAAACPPDYCFPFAIESAAILRWAREVDPGDGRASYYLGNLLYDLQPSTAVREWERARALEPGLSIIHRNLGLAYARLEGDIPKAVASLEKALACNPRDPRLYYELDLLYEEADASPGKRLELLLKNHDIVSLRDDALTREIGLLIDAGRYDRALALLKDRRFHVWEGGGEIHSFYIRAHLLRGREFLKRGDGARALRDFEAALGYPENLEVGVPYRGAGSPSIFYSIGTAREALGDKTGAAASFGKAASRPPSFSEEEYYRGLSLRRLGKEAEASAAFEGLDIEAERRLGEGRSARAERAGSLYVSGLARLGKGEKPAAAARFKEALALRPHHAGAQRMLAELKQFRQAG